MAIKLWLSQIKSQLVPWKQPQTTVMGLRLTPNYLERIPVWMACWNIAATQVLHWQWLLRWQYRYLVFGMKDQTKIRVALAAEKFRRMAPRRARARASTNEVMLQVLSRLDAHRRDVLARGLVEFSGWKELPDSMTLTGTIMYTNLADEAIPSRIRYVHLVFPSLQILHPTMTGGEIRASNIESAALPSLTMNFRNVVDRQEAAFAVGLTRLADYLDNIEL